MKHLKYMAIAVLVAALLCSTNVLAQMGGDQGQRLERELYRTDQLLEQAAEAVRQADAPLAEIRLNNARQLQDQAWTAFRDDRPLLAGQLTVKAREQAKEAVTLARQAQQYEGTVLRRLERAQEELEQARELMAEGSDQTMRSLLDMAHDNLQRAWEFYRQRQYKPALKLADRVEEAARRLLTMLGDGEQGRANYERRREQIRAYIADQAPLIEDCESPEATARLQQARQSLQMAEELSDKRQIDQALRVLRQAREMVLEASRICHGEDQLNRRYERLQTRADRMAQLVDERLAGAEHELAIKLLEQAREQLLLAREHLNDGSIQAASAALQAASLSLRQIGGYVSEAD